MRLITIAIIACLGISYTSFVIAQEPTTQHSNVLEEIWDVVNVRIAVNIGDAWTFGFNAENIFDEDYYVDGSVWPGDAVPGTPAPNYDPVIGTLGQPRRPDCGSAAQILVRPARPIIFCEAKLETDTTGVARQGA